MMKRFAALIAAVFLMLTGAAQAQSGGQFCVRAFEDRNGNGTIDGGEPLLTSGVSADLLNAENIIVGSALLSESPTAAQGVICFQFLAPGQYSMIVTSAEYSPTTPNTVTASISEGTLPTVVEFGGQRILVEPAAAADDQGAGGLTDILSLDNGGLPRIVLSLLGTLVVIAGMVVLGSVLYLLFLRRPQVPAAATRDYYAPPTPGPMPPVDDVDIIEDDEDDTVP